MSMKKTKDPVFQHLLETENNLGLQKLGLLNSNVWHEDPKRLVFTLSRYKFVSKMLAGCKNVAEVGCGDGFGARIVRQEVENLTITDFDPLFIKKFSEISSDTWPINAHTHDILLGPLDSVYDAIYSLDVLEHIDQKDEDKYLSNIVQSLSASGVAIIGMPSIESQPYACLTSQRGHINCKTGKDFKQLMENYFENVFLFSMNDEVVHTGFEKMAHYILTVCCGKN